MIRKKNKLSILENRVKIFFTFIFFIGLLFRSQSVILYYNKDIFIKISELPNFEYGLVFGAGLKEDNTADDNLYDRVITGVELYQKGKINKIIMTGDGGKMWQDEVSVMKQIALDLGVKEEDVLEDRLGIRTYESCVRAKNFFKIDTAIVVSQYFHLSRIIYLCDNLGVDVVGYPADRRVYKNEWRWLVRDFFAKFKAWLEVNFVKLPSTKYIHL